MSEESDDEKNIRVSVEDLEELCGTVATLEKAILILTYDDIKKIDVSDLDDVKPALESADRFRGDIPYVNDLMERVKTACRLERIKTFGGGY